MTPTKNHILILLSSSDKTSFGKEDFQNQSLPQKVFSAIWEVESEVNNGGFAQYFLNSSAESASFVVEALETVGAPKTASICERAIHAAFPAGLPQSVEAIRSAAASFSDETLAALEPLDEEFFSYHRRGVLFIPSQPHRFAVCLRIPASRGVWRFAKGRRCVRARLCQLLKYLLCAQIAISFKCLRIELNRKKSKFECERLVT